MLKPLPSEASLPKENIQTKNSEDYKDHCRDQLLAYVCAQGCNTQTYVKKQYTYTTEDKDIHKEFEELQDKFHNRFDYWHNCACQRRSGAGLLSKNIK